jgi:hypothetical protein
MGKGGESSQFQKASRKISLEELSEHRLPNDGKKLSDLLIILTILKHSMFLVSMGFFQG